MLKWESHNELHDFWRAEVSTDILESWEQPHTLKIVNEGKKHRYTPDRLDRLYDGKFRVVEVKDVFEAKKDPAYAEKLALANVVYQALGWNFYVVEKVEIEAQPTFSAISKIQSYRCAAMTPSDILKVRQLFSSSPTQTVGSISSFLQRGPAGFAQLCALIVRRVLSADLSNGLDADTTLHMVRWA